VPCGVPEQAWPYAVADPSGATNGIRFDPNTGRLWSLPADVQKVYTASTNWVALGDYGNLYTAVGWPTEYRFWFARGVSAGNGYGADVQVTDRPSITHTNTSARNQIMLVTPFLPGVFFNMTYWSAGAGVGLRYWVNGAFSWQEFLSPINGVHDVSGAFGLPPVYPYPAGWPFQGGGTSVPITNDVGSSSGNAYYDANHRTRSNHKSVGTLIEPRKYTLTPGQSITVAVDITCRTMQSATPLAGGIDPVFLWSYAGIQSPASMHAIVMSENL
jgi:hypothetical protein